MLDHTENHHRHSGLTRLFIVEAFLVFMAVAVIARTGANFDRWIELGYTPASGRSFSWQCWLGLLLPLALPISTYAIARYMPHSRIVQNVNAFAFLILGLGWVFLAFNAWLAPWR